MPCLVLFWALAGRSLGDFHSATYTFGLRLRWVPTVVISVARELATKRWAQALFKPPSPRCSSERSHTQSWPTGELGGFDVSVWCSVESLRRTTSRRRRRRRILSETKRKRMPMPTRMGRMRKRRPPQKRSPRSLHPKKRSPRSLHPERKRMRVAMETVALLTVLVT
jgi:hypothetical protein